jgi:PAS domain S-box-containing protein
MLSKHSLVWKVNAVFLAILVSAFGILGFVTNLVYERDALALARDVSKVNSETILHSINKLMMTRDNAGVRDLIDQLAGDNLIYRDIRLVSHSGGVVASRRRPRNAALGSASWPCNVCHGLRDPRDGLEIRVHDEVVESDDGGRIVSVVTPVYNEPRCSSADCHAHSIGTPVLGLLQADFSLDRVDALFSQRGYHSVLALLVAMLLSTAITWVMIRRLVGRRLVVLREGMDRVARRDFSFRFNDQRRDELALLAGSFDTMTTELSSALSALSHTRDYLQGIVENSADMIITVDPDGFIRTFNTGAERILGYDRTEVVGKRIEMLFADPSERDAAIAQLKHSDSVINYETHFLTKRGEVRDVILTLSRLRTPDGASIGTIGISKDLTREKELQRELLLKAKLAAIGQAITGIQHCLKNMVGSLQGGSYMVDTGLEEGDHALLEEGWAMVREGVVNVTELSSRMLHYVRGWEPDVEETDVAGLATSVCSLNRETARSRGVQLRVETARGLPKVRCDPRLIRAVVMDLLSNAFDACTWKDYDAGEEPEVVLRVHEAERAQHVELEVRDNGEGMGEEVMKNIFTPFFSTRQKLGTGMGLTLALSIVRLHGGTIEVESEPTRGSTFRVLLPVGDPTLQKEAPNAQESADH